MRLSFPDFSSYTESAYVLLVIFGLAAIVTLLLLVRGEIRARRKVTPLIEAPGHEMWPRRWDAKRFSALNVGAVLLGVLYGLFLRLETGSHPVVAGAHSGTITIAFLVLGPLVLGFLSIYPVERARHVNQARWLLQPWIPVWVTCAITALLKLEGAICIIMLLPIAMVLSSIGGVLGGLLARFTKAHPGTVACLAALPFLLAPAETYLHPPTNIRIVENTILIHATPANVWQQIQSVPPIAPSELKPTWTHAIGFPRPIAAQLSHPGVGGVRTASFERGLVFYETVTDWQPAHQLSFTIKADTAHIPATTLDEHVTIGGPYFDVLDGTYRIEPLPNNTVRLHLTSHQRLTTDVNSYVSLWTDAIMSNLQTSILQVIQHRCEHPTTYTSLNR